MRLKKKFYLSILLGLGIIGSSIIAFSAFTINNDISEEKNVDPIDVVVEDYRQKIISFDTNYFDPMGFRGNDIVKDTFSVSLDFDNDELTDRGLPYELEDIYLNSALKINVNFSNSSLFNHLNDVGFYSFIDFSFGNTSNKLSMEQGKEYKYFSGLNNESKDCISFSNNSLQLIIPTMEERCSSLDESSKENFYIYKIYNDYKVANMRSWSFHINFNFQIVDSFFGYSKKFTKANFGKVTINISFEDLRYL